MSGWFAVKHGITKHPVFKGDFAKIGMFLWMIENAAKKPTEVDIGGKPYVIPRGSLCFSQRYMADTFGISTKALRTFIQHLVSHNVVTTRVVQTGTARETRRTQLTLCNYEKYQTVGNNTEPRRKQQGNKESQEDTIPVGEASTEAPADPAKVIFSQGLKILTSGGVSEKQARSVLGKWRKESGDAALIEALGRCQRTGAIQPVEFITGCLKAANRNKAASGERRETSDGRVLEFEQGVGWQEVYA